MAHRRAQGKGNKLSQVAPNQLGCNAPTGGVRPDVGKGVRLLGKSTGAMASLRQQEFISPKVDVQAWPLSNTTVQEELL